MKREFGFTLIEMLIVIIIITILAVIALPKFLDTSKDAQMASITATASAFKSGVKNVQLLWEMAGNPQNQGGVSNGPQVSYGSQLVTVDEDTGLPVGEHNNDRGTNMNVVDCVTVFEDVLTNAQTVVRRRNNTTNRVGFDYVTARQNHRDGDICFYYLVDAIPADERDPTNSAATDYIGFWYNAETGETEVFDLTN